LSLNQSLLSITYDQINDWSSATSSFLTSSSNLNANNINSGVVGASYIPTITYKMTNFTDQNLLTISNPVFVNVTGSNFLTTGLKFRNYGIDQYSSATNTAAVNLNFYGYQDGANYFRNVDIYDGKQNLIARFQGSTGNLIITGTITGYYESGDYGVAWASISLPSGSNGMMFTAYNSNAGVLASRLYIYSNSAWHYIAII
jgi:hypothetical protein